MNVTGLAICDGFDGLFSKPTSLRAYREFLKNTRHTHHTRHVVALPLEKEAGPDNLHGATHAPKLCGGGPEGLKVGVLPEKICTRRYRNARGEAIREPLNPFNSALNTSHLTKLNGGSHE